MSKLFLMILLVSVTFHFSSSSVVAQSRKDIFERFKNAVNAVSEHNPLSDPRIERALRYLIIEGRTERARRLLKEAGWPNGFSIDLPLSVFGTNRTEIQWLEKELGKIGIYVQVVN